MKKLLFLSAIITAIVALSVSCRKGPNDPFLSIRSRDSRIVGSWKIKGLAIDSTVAMTSSLKTDDRKYHIDFVNDSLKIFSDPNGNTKDSVYKEILTINEDGSYIDSIVSKKNGTTLNKLRIVRNEWYWTEAKKKKDGIVLVGYGAFRIDRLAWKELVLTSYRQSVNYTNKELSYGTNSIVNKVLTFKRN